MDIVQALRGDVSLGERAFETPSPGDRVFRLPDPLLLFFTVRMTSLFRQTHPLYLRSISTAQRKRNSVGVPSSSANVNSLRVYCLSHPLAMYKLSDS